MEKFKLPLTTYTIDILDNIYNKEDSDGDHFSLKILKEELAKAATIGCGRLIINIKSRGGSTSEALAIYDELLKFKKSNVEIITIVYGEAASSATMIAQAGDVRVISSRAVYLIHRCSWSNFSEVSKRMKYKSETMVKIDDIIIELYVERAWKSILERIAKGDTSLSGMTKDDIKKDILDIFDSTEDGIWLDPQQAIDACLVDKILDL